MLQRWRSAPDCKSGVFDLGGSNPSTPTMVIIFSLVFVSFAWLALLSAEENRDMLMILGVAGAFVTVFVANLYY